MIGRGEFGPVFGEPVELSGEQAPLVEHKGLDEPTSQGVVSTTRTKLTFFFPLVVTDRDRFKVGEEEWEVATHEGLLDPELVPYMTVVVLGQATAARQTPRSSKAKAKRPTKRRK
jgi:hypothetical protein